MTESKLRYLRALLVILLIAVIITGSIAAWLRYAQAAPLEIILKPSPQIAGEVYVDGGVNNPGIYPVYAGDSLDDIINAAGGLAADAAPDRLRLSVPRTIEEQVQKIDLNRAEAWLLQALPGIGETRAQAIIAYRAKHGGFRNTADLLNVEGIGTATYDNIKHLITVAE
ncbi:MAG: ComEA family DNA-binding protein [Dehalococcoidales bacterium]|nr:ComEA family DNA-binding protein [Dehalococcoidales bacterium]